MHKNKMKKPSIVASKSQAFSSIASHYLWARLQDVFNFDRN